MLVENPKAVARLFAFLDLAHPAVAWAVMRGMLVSADLASPKPMPGFISFMQAGMITHQNNPRIFNEFVIERIRAKSHPHAVSRLRGMYFFGSRREALARVGDRNWPSYFQSENLLEFELLSPEDITVVDSSWVTFAPLANDGKIKPDSVAWVERYWNGDVHGDAPVWEHIAKGVAIIEDEQVRRRCFAAVKALFPKSKIPILMARLAGEAGSRGGLIHPFLHRQDDSTVRLRYVWRDADFHDKDVIDAIAKHPDSGYLGRLIFENECWPKPDFRPWERAFRVAVQADPEGILGTISSVHHS